MASIHLGQATIQVFERVGVIAVESQDALCALCLALFPRGVGRRILKQKKISCFRVGELRRKILILI
jgi:hypothetical protein